VVGRRQAVNGLDQDRDALRRGVLADAVAEVEDVAVAAAFACLGAEAGEDAGDLAPDRIGAGEERGRVEVALQGDARPDAASVSATSFGC